MEVFGIPPVVYTNLKTGQPLISVYLAEASQWTRARHNQLNAGLARLHQLGIQPERVKFTAKKIRRQDWAESWKKHFKPIELGNKLLIKPSWIRKKPKPDQAVIVLDPGLSFGTGNHPTTLFCLEALARFRNRGPDQSFLDIGTGSGILAIAAAKLGYRPVRAVDFDPESVRMAAANARQNHVQLQLKREDLTKIANSGRIKYGFICANLQADLLLTESQKIINHLKIGGLLALAGILVGEFESVQRSYEAAGLRLIRSKSSSGEWKSGLFQLR